MLEVGLNSKQSGGKCSETGRKKKKGWWEGFAEKESIKPRMKEYVGGGIMHMYERREMLVYRNITNSYTTIYTGRKPIVRSRA